MSNLINPHRFAVLGPTYWRLFITASNGGTYVTLTEVEFRGALGGPDLAVGGTASASSEYSGSTVASQAFDDTTTWSWGSASGDLTDGAWLQYQFTSPVNIVQVALTVHSSLADSESPTAFSLQSATSSGGPWTTVQSWSPAAWVNGETRTFDV